MAGGEGGRSASETRMQFFKVLMPGFSERLSIPRAFTKFIAHKKRMTVTILSPLGRFWHVKLNPCGSDLFLGKGWKEFALAHGFAIGWLLVFRYEGNMVFTIKVFDLSACLKMYNEIDGFRYSTMLEEGSLETNALEKDEMNCPVEQPKCKEEYMESYNEVDNEEEEDDNEEEEEDDDDEEEDVKEIKPKSRARMPSSKKTRQVYTFEKIIRPYNLRYNKIGIPKDFCAAQGLSSRRKIALKDTKDRSWPVHFCVSRSNENFLRKGWDEFCKANHVEPGDRCTFRVESKRVIRVHVLKH